MRIILWCLGLLFAACTCLAQMYTVMDLGSLGGGDSVAFGINNSGQVAGSSSGIGGTHAFRTAPNKPINPTTDDLGIGVAHDINVSGQVVGSNGNNFYHAFRTAPNTAINPITHD